MTSRSIRVFITAALIAVAARADAAAPVPPAVGKPLKAAQSLARSNPGAALAQVNSARAAARTPGERAQVAEMAAYVYAASGQWAQAAQAYEALGKGPAVVAPYYYRAGQYDKAIALARRAGGGTMQTLIAQSYVKKGDHRAAVAAYQQMVRGGSANSAVLGTLASEQNKLGDKAGYMATIRQLIRVDPSPNSWKALLIDLKSQPMTSDAKLAVYQLMRQTNTLTDPNDLQEMSKLAILGDLSGVALGALQDAQKAGTVPSGDAMTQKLIQAADQRAKAAVAAIPRQPATPAGRMAAGDALFGSGQYPQAAAAYAQVIAANGPTADHARILRGIALTRANNAAAGKQAFDGVPHTSPFNDVAQLWSLYASTHKA